MERRHALRLLCSRVGTLCSVAGLVLTPFIASKDSARYLALALLAAGIVLSASAVLASLRSRDGLGDAAGGLLVGVVGVVIWIALVAGGTACPP